MESEIPFGEESNATDYKKHIEYALKLPDQENSIFLARAYHAEIGPGRVLGFNAESFKIVTLAPDVLLHANWGTAVQGSGSYVCGSDLLLAKKDGKWVEVFRDTHSGYSKSGLAHTSSSQLTFSFDSQSRTLLIRRTDSQFDFYEGKVYPLGRQVSIGIEEHNKGLPAFASHYSIVTDWPCKLENGALTWGPGTCFLELGPQPFPTLEVVTFLRISSQIPSIQDSTDEDIATSIRKLNSQFGDSGVYWGTVRIKNDLPKYEENRLHRYRMDS